MEQAAAPKGLRRLSSPRILDDGQVAFTIEADNAEPLTVACAPSALGDIVSFLCHLAAAEGSPPEPGPISLPTVPVRGMGFVTTNDPQSTLLLVRFQAFSIGLQLDSSKLAALAGEWSRIAAALSAHGKPN
ncbi:MAG TPA: hypothetical protein VFA50_16170 [Stellaceae bacterium]|nr:hypothetical protein [Stellaceae bacterium]